MPRTAPERLRCSVGSAAPPLCRGGHRQVVRLLNEPTAIAIARWHPAAVHETNLMVVDVGAAALQASLITVEHGVYEVRTRHSAVELCSTHSGPTCLCHAYVCTAYNAHLPACRTTD